ncbi:MAG: glycoside hydrolase family 19 protein [Pseudomonadota bacterium]
MPRGMVVEPIDPLVWNGKWRRIRATFSSAGVVEGYSAVDYLTPVNARASNTVPVAPAPSPKPPPEELKDARDNVPGFALSQLNPLTPVGTARRYENELHLVFLERVRELLDKCRRRNLRFRLFEAYRQPDRQADLFNSGRNVTKADAWQSMHNYGLAADIILNVQGVNPWETGRVGRHDYMRDWLAMRDIAQKCGLKVLKTRDGRDYDYPHVQFPDKSWKVLQSGDFPEGGGSVWAANLLRNIKAYPRGAPTELSKLDYGNAKLVADGDGNGSGGNGAAQPREPERPAPPPPSRKDVIARSVPASLVAGLYHHSAAANVERYLPMVLEALREQGLDSWPHIITALGTINAESAGFKSIPEGQSRYNTEPGGEPFAKYDFRTDIGNNALGDGFKYRGRGFIQLTGKDNYKRYGERLGIDLVNDPDLALEPMTAARILALFMADQKERIERAWQSEDWKDARAAVNGGSHGLDAFEKVVKAARHLFDWSKPI